MQKRLPLAKAGVPGKRKPSRKRSPRCPPHAAQRHSAPSSAARSGAPSNCTPASAPPKEGQPVPESNLSREEKSGAPHAAHAKVPLRFSRRSGEERGGSVPPSRNTKYCCAESSAAHSLSGRCTAYPAVREAEAHAAAGESESAESAESAESEESAESAGSEESEESTGSESASRRERREGRGARDGGGGARRPRHAGRAAHSASSASIGLPSS
mmetsp:Transcript_44906/g.111810  ORF Transcript_44906/g.111810 Transcript_44906/m.111810 type:complete len:214 (+) Transcript_44906:339-980(+)